MMLVTRDKNGVWWNERMNRCFVGEDAKILDKLLKKDKENHETK